MPMTKMITAKSAYRRQSLWIILGVGMIIAVTAAFGAMALARFKAAEASWEAYTQRAVSINVAFADLNRDIGYGGFIHNFKNLVLRRDLPRYQARIEDDLSGLNGDMDRLDGVLTMPKDRAALAQVRATFAEYADVYRRVPALIRAGNSPAEIDAVVKVSDTAALAAIRRLAARNTERAQTAQQNAQSLQARASLFLRLGGLVVLAAILGAAAVMIQFQKRVVAANDAKKVFLASMSHEIRTPMNAILGLAYLLEKGNLPAEGRDLARKIVAAGKSLLRIIDDILDFSKIEAGRLEIGSEPFYLSEVIDNLATIMAAYASDKKIELVIAPPPSGDYYLRGDAQRLGQVLINLVGNAVKFTDAGHVVVAISVLGETEQQVILRFDVRDTGIGISAKKQQEIFAPFSQADTTITRRFGGTGLGLTISRRLVTLMGGELGVTSTAGCGSEFGFTLSFDRLPGTRFSAPEMAHLNVLIADDSPIAMEALQNTAKGLGWHATTVDSGEEALKHVLAKEPDQGSEEVLIVDWHMPGMDGLATTRAIREARRDAHDPIILLVTAYAREELLAQPDSVLADAILSKPVTPSSLYDAVAQVHRKRHGNLAAAPTVLSQGRLAHVRVLVADDSDINREVAQRILAGEGAHVILVNDGQQAVDWLQAHAQEIDIVLMDVQMPVMDGYAATRQIRDTLGLKDLPVVALTAGAFQEQKEAAAAAGMTDYISKPFDVEAAIALILKYVGRAHQKARMAKSSSGSVASTPSQDLPGLAVARGMAIWKDVTVYQQYLRKFASDYRDSVNTMAEADPAMAATLAHKLTGAAGSLALTELAAMAAEADGVLRAREDPGVALARLQAAMEIALASIQRFAPVESPMPFAPTDIDNTRDIAPLLRRTLEALNTDNPDAVRPVLVELGKILPSARLAALYRAVEGFDFRGGETLTRTLAVELGISLEDA
ncbi:MAG TPA: response regulator [Rhodocyclaceae bacterium]|nr:response regulator [Rhodocyclaceae bacterium]